LVCIYTGRHLNPQKPRDGMTNKLRFFRRRSLIAEEMMGIILWLF